MLKRTITALIGVAILIPILLLSGTFVFPIAVAFFAVKGMFEMFRCLGEHKNIVLTFPFYIVGGVAPFVVRFMSDKINVCGAALLAMALLIIYALAIVVFSKNKTTFAQASAVFTSAAYIVFAFCGIIYLRDMENKYIYILVFIGAWITDIFAYLVGRALGRHKLLPDISPKKTIGNICSRKRINFIYTPI